MNLVRLKQTAKQNALQDSQNEKTAEAIRKAEKDFSVYFPLLVDETAKNTKIFEAIIALKNGQSDKIVHPYRPHREHVATRCGLLFYNDKIIIPEAMRSRIIAMLHQSHVSTNEMDQLAETFWWPGLHREIRDKTEICPSCRASGKSLKTQLPQTETNRLGILNEPNERFQ